MTGRICAKLALFATLSACGGMVGCSSSAGTPPGGSTSPPATTTLSTDQVQGLQGVLQRAQATKSTPLDRDTALLAAQISELQFDRTAALGSATMLQASAADPANKSTASQLGTYRQQELTLAASDQTKIQSLLASSKAAGKALVATEGGASQVLGAIVAQSFGAQAQAFLTAGTQAAANGTAGPTSDTLSTFLQEEAVVTSDEASGGHDVAGRVIANALIGGASVASLMATNGVGP
jgi:hypothetical protein